MSALQYFCIYKDWIVVTFGADALDDYRDLAKKLSDKPAFIIT